MAEKTIPNASLAATTVLLTIACLNIGYGLCMSANGAMLSGLAVLFIVRSAKAFGEHGSIRTADG